MSSSDVLGNSIALVTGASSGLGRHFATVLARAGATVALAARRIETLEELARDIEASGRRALAVRMDVTSDESVRTAFDLIEATFGTPDLIINNAGVAITKPLLEQTEADWDSVLDTNLKGAFLVATEGARRLRAQRHGGSIINIASILGFRQGWNVTSYAASKAGMVQLTRSMALELARFDIRVNAIAPGYFNTDMNKDFWGTPHAAEMLKRIPQRRLGEPEELDGALLLLASNASKYMTGAIIPVDGGHLVSTL
jgi:NAD(P)-dependent dehydrogenase (short-subunit alcohol dehydrogenase family)